MIFKIGHFKATKGFKTVLEGIQEASVGSDFNIKDPR